MRLRCGAERMPAENASIRPNPVKAFLRAGLLSAAAAISLSAAAPAFSKPAPSSQLNADSAYVNRFVIPAQHRLDCMWNAKVQYASMAYHKSYPQGSLITQDYDVIKALDACLPTARRISALEWVVYQDAYRTCKFRHLDAPGARNKYDAIGDALDHTISKYKEQLRATHESFVVTSEGVVPKEQALAAARDSAIRSHSRQLHPAVRRGMAQSHVKPGAKTETETDAGEGMLIALIGGIVLLVLLSKHAKKREKDKEEKFVAEEKEREEQRRRIYAAQKTPRGVKLLSPAARKEYFQSCITTLLNHHIYAPTSIVKLMPPEVREEYFQACLTDYQKTRYTRDINRPLPNGIFVFGTSIHDVDWPQLPDGTFAIMPKHIKDRWTAQTKWVLYRYGVERGLDEDTLTLLGPERREQYEREQKYPSSSDSNDHVYDGADSSDGGTGAGSR